ncbi:MAG: hypothetical protein II135_12035, partial [Clostridia bacterium]|nr:hypothetical protein [Clostridia bacterium]
MNMLRLVENWGNNKATRNVAKLASIVTGKKNAVDNFLREVDICSETLAEDIVNSVLPTDMSEINPDNIHSVYGLFTKKDENNQTYFVHPISARYLLYKLSNYLKKIKDNTALKSEREAAQNGHGNDKPAISFDNPWTRNTEKDALEYLESIKKGKKGEKGIDKFIEKYTEFNKGQAALCRVYAISSLKYNFAVKLSERLEKLIIIVEDFFNNLVKVSNTLNDSLAANIRANNQVDQKTIFVCASEKDKYALYDSLGVNVDTSNVSINKIIVNALYGKLCAEEFPDLEGNKEYKGKSVETIFYTEVINEYSEIIKRKYKGQIDLDIYSAICRSADIEFEEEEKKAELEREANDLDGERLNINPETGESTEIDAKNLRHISAMRAIVEKLIKLGSPCLITDNEQPDDPDEHLKSDADNNDDEEVIDEFDEFTPVKKHKTFWGFNPVVAAKCPELGQILGVNVASQQNSAYDKNVLECYRAVYGVMTKYVVKFNELAGGDYYKNYRQVVRKMIERVGQGDETALVSTPHIDKTWHLFMPYVTKEMQEHEDVRFFRLFWLAFAYGMITVTKGKYRIKRKIKTALGSNEVYENIKLNGRSINVTDVVELIAALKLDGKFMIDAVKCEKQFEKECDLIVNYEGTEFLRGKSTKDPDTGNKVVIGGLASKDDVNAVTLIVRYCNSPRSRVDVISMLINSLERLCMELVKGNYDPVRQKNGIKRAGYELCKRIYNASAMRDKDNDFIKDWKRRWSQVEDDD